MRMLRQPYSLLFKGVAGDKAIGAPTQWPAQKELGCCVGGRAPGMSDCISCCQCSEALGVSILLAFQRGKRGPERPSVLPVAIPAEHPAPLRYCVPSLLCKETRNLSFPKPPGQDRSGPCVSLQRASHSQGPLCIGRCLLSGCTCSGTPATVLTSQILKWSISPCYQLHGSDILVLPPNSFSAPPPLGSMANPAPQASFLDVYGGCDPRGCANLVFWDCFCAKCKQPGVVERKLQSLCDCLVLGKASHGAISNRKVYVLPLWALNELNYNHNNPSS